MCWVTQIFCGTQTVDLVHAKDIGRTMMKAMISDVPEQYEKILDAGTGIATSVVDTVRMVLDFVHNGSGKFFKCSAEDLEKEGHVKFLPMRPGEPEHSETLGKIADTKKILDYVPTTPPKTGLKETVEWYRENYKTFFKEKA